MAENWLGGHYADPSDDYSIQSVLSTEYSNACQWIEFEVPLPESGVDYYDDIDLIDHATGVE